MDRARAQSVLKRVIGHLPEEFWWQLRQDTKDELGLAYAFDLPCADIDALLANAGIYKDGGHGFAFKKKIWGLFCDTLDGEIDKGSYGRAIYVANKTPPLYSKPALQLKANVRCINRAELPADIIAEIRESTKLYYGKKSSDDDNKRKRKNEATGRAIQYPFISKHTNEGEDISLANPKVKELAGTMASDIYHLHKVNNSVISFTDGSGKVVSLQDIPCANDSHQYMIYESRHNWLRKIVEASVGGEMTMAEGIICMRKCLDRLERNVVATHKEVSPCSDGTPPNNGSITEPQQPKPKKQKSEDKCQDIAKVLAPRFTVTADTLQWTNGDAVKSSQAHDDCKELCVAVNAISRGNTTRAAQAVGNMLLAKDHSEILEGVQKSISKKEDEHLKLCELFIKGIHDSNKHHNTGGTRTMAAETFVKNNVTACLFKIVKDKHDVSDHSVTECLGITRHQVKYAREQIQDLLKNNSQVSAVQRKIRKDFIRLKLEKYVFDYLSDDEYTRLDTKQGLVDVEDPRTGEMVTVHQRIYRIANKVQQYEMFKSSDYYKEFQKDNPGATVGYDIYAQVRNKIGRFVKKPLNESCVDERMSSLEHMMAALLGVIKRKDVKKELEKYKSNGNHLTYTKFYEHLRKAGGYQMIESILCPAVQQQDLHYDESKECPSLIPFKCTHGSDFNREDRCTACGVPRKLGILDDLCKLEDAKDNVEVMIWQDSARQGTKKVKGKVTQNTQRELHPETMTVEDLVGRFKKQLEVCIPHYQEICWIRLTLKADLERLRPGEMLILTDFASVMSLRAFQTKNSSVDGHAVNDNFVCIYNKRIVKVSNKRKKKDNEIEFQLNEQEVVVFTVDVHHFFAETISKGKKSDHAMHHTCLDAIIGRYKKVFQDDLSCTLDKIIVWTDNAPGQYRCRQNFVKVVSVCERHHHIKLVHRLAVPDNFKGIHDAVGKDPAHLVRALELIGIRSPNAFKVFVNCMERLEKTIDDTEWIKYEQDGDDQLLRKGVYGMDSRRVWFVVETKAEFDRLSAQYPGRVLLCDRTFVLDTHNSKPLNKSNNLHEVCSIATSIPAIHPRVWPCKASYLPCSCIHCFTNPENNQCKFAPWRNRHSQDVKIKCLYPEEAESWVGSFVCQEGGNINNYRLGKALKFLPESCEWEVQYVDGEVKNLAYAEICSEKNLYQSILQQQHNSSTSA